MLQWSRYTGDHNNPMTATWLQQQTSETRSDCRGGAPDPPTYVLAQRSSLTMVLCYTNATFIH